MLDSRGNHRGVCSTTEMSLPELTVGEVNYNSIELKWEDPENNNNKKRKLFHVQLNRARARSPCPGGPMLDPLTNYQGYSQQYVFKGLESMTQYLCRLRIMDSEIDRQGNSGWSEPITVCTANEPPSGAELHKAVSRQDLEKVRQILEEHIAVVEVMDKFGLTPLMVAAQKGFTDVMEILLEFNADPEYSNSSGKTALMIACYAGQEDAAKLLREHGASWETRDRNGLTAVHWTADGGHDDLLLWVLRKGGPVDIEDSVNGWTPLMRVACLTGNDEVAEVLIGKGADINRVDKSGKTVLMAASMNGHFNLVRLLVDKGADVFLKNREGKTALEFARSMERQRIIKYLEFQVAKDEKQRKAKLLEEKLKENQVKLDQMQIGANKILTE